IVGSWAVVAGLVQVFAAFGAGEAAGMRALLVIGGLVTIAFGVALFAHPGVGALTLAVLFGLFNLTYGTWGIVQGIDLRRVDKSLPSITQDRREKAAAA